MSGDSTETCYTCERLREMLLVAEAQRDEGILHQAGLIADRREAWRKEAEADMRALGYLALANSLLVLGFVLGRVH